MKTRIYFNSIPVLILLACLMAFATCKKDDEPEKNYRVIASNDYYNNVLSGSTQLAYEGERITLISGYYNEAKGDSAKTHFEYPDNNSITGTDFEKAGGQWNKVGKTEYSFQDTVLVQAIYYEFFHGAFVASVKKTFKYTSGNLIEEIRYLYYAGSWNALYRDSYSYDGDKVRDGWYWVNNSGTWKVNYKDVVTYNGDNIDFILESEYNYFNDSFYESYKYEFVYENGRIKQVNMFYIDDYSETWINDGSLGFTYDANGNLESISESFEGNIYKTEFIYEEGKGNVEQVFFTGGGIISMVNPIPTKATLRAITEIDKYFARKTR